MNLRRYLSDGKRAGLPLQCAQISSEFWKQYGTSEAQHRNKQSHDHLWDAYDAATKQAQQFDEAFLYFSRTVGVYGVTRPDKIKSVQRSFEKMVPKNGTLQPIPLDLLGGKLIFTNLCSLYDAVSIIEDHFTIRCFKDRFIFRRPSGYRDLQFSIEFNGLLAEIKFMHKTIDEIDRYEHKVYEILRSIDAKGRTGLDPTFAEGIVVAQLREATERMYNQAWKDILEGEGRL